MSEAVVQRAHQLGREGAVRAQRGDYAGAVEMYREAVAVWPGFAEGHASIGSLLAAQGRFGEAVVSYREALRLKPEFVECQFIYGHALIMLGEHAAAREAFLAVVRRMPKHVEALHGLGVACKSLGQVEDAVKCFVAVIGLAPGMAEAQANLGGTLEAMGRFEEALACHERAVGLQPANAEMQLRRGVTLGALGRFEEAVGAYGRALAPVPGHFGVLNNLGIAQRMLGNVDGAAEAFRAATVSGDGTAGRSQRDVAAAWMNLGVVLDLKGERGEALACHRRAVALAPGDQDAWSNMLYSMHFHPEIGARELLEEHRAWDRAMAAPLRAGGGSLPDGRGSDWSFAGRNRDAERRLRVGYVSPDFRDHPVGRFMVPLVGAHDRGAVEVYCYADMLRDDAVTAEIRRHAAVWRDIRGMSDEAVAELVRRDQIDILVDLTMHMAGSRLLVFARKPAPVQVTYLAYVSTTGLGTMDYRLSDPYLDPEGDGARAEGGGVSVGQGRGGGEVEMGARGAGGSTADGGVGTTGDGGTYSEETVRLPQYWCYGPPPPRDAPEVNGLPALGNGFVTFGCLNGFSKVSAEAVGVWARVLLAVPGSRLMLHANPGSHRERVWVEFERHGVERGRVEFVGLANLAGYFATYGRIDIALDPMPYAGGTTTCDALWMGVPVVTLRGGRAVGRGGVSILSSLGVPEWIAGTGEEYVGIAARLAGDLAGLARWRGELRGRMRRSRLMDAAGFARGGGGV